MPLWSFPGVVKDIDVPYVNVTLDLGLRLYADTPVRVAGLNADERDLGRLTELLPVGARVLAVCDGLPGGPVRAHLALADGRDVATLMRGRRTPKPLTSSYGGTLAKVWTYPASVVHPIDGDTFQACVATGSTISHHLPVRVSHVNSPEKDTAEGQAAQVWAERVLTPGVAVTVTASRLEKFGRILGTVTLADGDDYGQALIGAGHAVPYEGGPR
jgi:endonuclease YncB( thermonuclease family)